VIATAISDVAVAVVFGLFALGLVCVLVDAWRHDQELKRRSTKRSVNQARLARLHVIDRDPDGAA
jgi:hypothetical protein